MHLLSIDWDFFFKTEHKNRKIQSCYDWGHSENQGPALQNSIWTIRASDFLFRDMPLPSTTGEEFGFWEGFKFSKGTRLLVADSHFELILDPVRFKVDTVTNFDAHHDFYGKCIPHTWNCGNWALYYHDFLEAEVRTRYPAWRSFYGAGETCIKNLDIQHASNADKDVTYDRVFICRSGAWTPPWLDEAFVKFVKACPVYRKSTGLPESRKFDRKQAVTLSDQLREMTGILCATKTGT